MEKYTFSYLGEKRNERHKKHKKQLLHKILLTLFVLFVTGFVIGGITILIIFKSVSKDLPKPDELSIRQIAQSTKIYDKTGENLLYEIHGEEKRTLIEIENIPQSVILATIAAEDRGFYEHQGINIRGLLRAIYKDIVHRRAEGGSSITQQLVVNALLTRGTTTWQKIQRKFREWILAYQIEQKYTKDEIMQMYLNEIPYGSNAYGVEAASKTFFKKSISDVTIAEAALLATLPNKPTRYSPYGSHTDEMYARQKWILRHMKDQNQISEEEYEQAINEELNFNSKLNNITAPHFVMYVKEYLSQKYGEQILEKGGLKITTTLDLDKQKIAEEIITEKTENYPEKYNATNASLLSIDTHTGQILAMVGSRDYYNNEIDGQVNLTTRNRQPGSSFKPIVYASAFQKGYTPETVLFDVETTFKAYPKDYTPHNYDGEEHGPVTIRKAIAGSLNIPAVKTIYLTGIDKVLDFADNLEYTTLKDRSRFGLSLVLGGGEVKMTEHLSAFSTFAQGGVWRPTVSILKVEDANGNALEEYKQIEKKKFDRQIARQINNILSDNEARIYAFGVNNYLNLGERPVAVKTGTTNDYRDAWTMGYTPSIATAVWVGNNDFSEMKRGAAGGVIAAPIWQAFMKKVLEDEPLEYFKDPEPTKATKPVLTGEYKIPSLVKIDKLSGKLATENTPKDYIEEKTFYEFHNILYYLDKDDPYGEGSGRNDEQFENWETAVQEWIKEKQEEKLKEGEENPYIVELPPDEVEETHTFENQPTINFTTPQENSTITDRNFTATISYTIPSGNIKRVRYYIDDVLIKMVTMPPFAELKHTFNNISNGFHKLKAEAYDDAGNFGSTEINLNFLFGAQPISVEWLGPLNNSSFPLTSMPTQIKIKISDHTQIQKIEFYSNDHLIETVSDINSSDVSISWEEQDVGEFNLYANVINKQGIVYKSAETKITIK